MNTTYSFDYPLCVIIATTVDNRICYYNIEIFIFKEKKLNLKFSFKYLI